jgi:hypothetical protein
MGPTLIPSEAWWKKRPGVTWFIDLPQKHCTTGISYASHAKVAYPEREKLDIAERLSVFTNPRKFLILKNFLGFKNWRLTTTKAPGCCWHRSPASPPWRSPPGKRRSQWWRPAEYFCKRKQNTHKNHILIMNFLKGKFWWDVATKTLRSCWAEQSWKQKLVDNQQNWPP